jgi:hypothetical protein
MTTGSRRLQSKGVQGVQGVQGEKPGARILSLYSLRLLVLLVLLLFSDQRAATRTAGSRRAPETMIANCNGPS